jgi:hypothetical protein
MADHARVFASATLGIRGLQVALLLENYVNRPAGELDACRFGEPVARPCSNTLIWEDGTPTGTVCYSSHSAWQQIGVPDGEYLFRLVYKAQSIVSEQPMGLFEAEPHIDLSRP